MAALNEIEEFEFRKRMEDEAAAFATPATTTTQPATQDYQRKQYVNEQGEVVPTPGQFLGDVRDITAGAVRGSTTLPLSVSRLWQTKQTVDEKKAQIDSALQDLLGADPTSMGYSFGKLTGEIAGTAGIPGTLAKFTRPFSPLAAASLESGGFANLSKVSPTANWLTRTGATIGGGATTGAATGLALNPDEGVGLSTVLGAGLPVVGKTLSAIAPVVIDSTKALYNRFANPQVAAENQLLQMTGGNQQAITNALMQSRGMPTTPGYKPTLPERLYAGGVSDPVIAAEAERLKTATDEANRIATAAEAKNVAALQQQQGRIESTVAPSTQAVLPGTSQVKVGESLAERAEKLKEGFKSNIVSPAYTKAYKLAGNAPIDVTNVISAAENILGRTLTQFAPETAPATVRKLAQLQSRGQAATEPTYSSLGLQTSAGTPAIPPNATLEELDQIRQAINADIGAAKESTAKTASTELSNLYKLHKAIDDAVTNSTTLSKAAKDAYTTALDTYRTGYVPRFKTGDLVDLFRTTNKNEARLLPENTVAKIFESENNINQFATTYKGDPQAVKDLKDGVVDLYRMKVVDPETGAINSKASATFMANNKAKLDLLEKNGISVRAELKKANDVAEWQNAFSDLKADIPKVTDQNVQVRLVGGLSNNQLNDLRVLTEDVKRRKAVETLARKGTAAGVDEAKLPGASTVSKTYSIAKAIAEMMSGKTDKKIAAELARVMYDNPDAAIDMLKNASKRSAKTTAFRGKVAKVAEQTSKVAIQSVNALSNRQSTNALRPE
jgi:hypothetical protein